MTSGIFRSNRGFSIIELMIVVAIIGILAAVAFPAYQVHVRRTRQADGLTRLMDIKAAQEKFYALEDTYYQPPGGILSAANTQFRGMLNFNVANTIIHDFTITSPAGDFTIDYQALSRNDLDGDGNRLDCWTITNTQDEPTQDTVTGTCTLDGENLSFSFF